MAETGVDPRPGYPIRAVDRVCDILDILANAQDGASLTDVAEQSELPKSSAFRYLAALEARRYVERNNDDGLYRLGLAFRPKDASAIDQLVSVGRPEIEHLRDKLKETVNIGVLDGAEVLHVAVAESPHMMRLAARVYERGPIHSTALGKVMSTELPEDRVRSILAKTGMHAFTERTITTPDAYIAELDRVRTEGFAVDDEENQLDGRCLAVRIPHPSLLAGVSVSAPLNRFPTEQIPHVMSELRKLARKLGNELGA